MALTPAANSSRRRFVVSTGVLALCVAGLSGCPLIQGIQDHILGPPQTTPAPRTLQSPQLDGACDEPAYAGAGKSMMEGKNKLQVPTLTLHSGQDLYLCWTQVPQDAERLVARIDSGGGTSTVSSATYELRVERDGKAFLSKLTPDGAQPLQVPSADLQAAVGAPAGTWNAEARVKLDWLGGYARTDRLYLAARSSGGAIAAWPAGAQDSRPETWGALTLGPIYQDTPGAASLFLDGREGYLAIPSTPALNPKQITVEAWIRTVDGDCGTLVGNGKNRSYWVGVCHVLQLGLGGGPVLSGQRSLDDGWHHVAATVDEHGRRTLLVDGEVDATAGGRPIEEKELPRPINAEPPPPRGFNPQGHASTNQAKLAAAQLPQVSLQQPIAIPASERTLRIGSDPDETGPDERLHGYIRELRIWSRARSPEEIRAAASQSLTGKEPGLVGLWPLTTDLRDRVAKHDAGLVGNASLAREAPPTLALASPPSTPAYDPPASPPTPAWNGGLPLDSSAPITVDGACAPAEYEIAARVALEPTRAPTMRMKLRSDGLYLCTEPVWGRGDAADGVTLWIDMFPQPGQAPGQADLRVHLGSDGTLTAATGNGQGWYGASPQGITGKVIHFDRLSFQEDVRPVNAPMWSGEIKVPIELISPLLQSPSFRIAVKYQGRVLKADVSQLSQDRALSATWPASFDENNPTSWGVSTLYTPGVIQAPMGMTIPRDAATAWSEAMQGDDPDEWPSAQPPESKFHTSCPDISWDDPVSWFEYSSYIYNEDNKWPLVDWQHHPYVRAEGIMGSLEVSHEDMFLIHGSHDLDMYVTTWGLSNHLVLNTDGSGGRNRELVLETETAGIPPNGGSALDARPEAGDHVIGIGRWIFDCGHSPKTEVHPLYVLESDRLEARPSGLGGALRPARVARVWMNSRPGSFYSHPLDRPFHFSLPMPTGAGAELPYLRVVQGPSAAVTASLAGDKVDITITPPQPTGSFFFELMLGALAMPDSYPGSYDYTTKATYTVTLDSLDVIKDKDDSFTRGDGDWYLSANVNGRWRKIFWGDSVDDGMDSPGVPLNMPIPVVGGNLTIQMTGYEGDSPSDDGTWCTICPFCCFTDDEIGVGRWNLGPLASQPAGQQKLCTTRPREVVCAIAKVADSSPLFEMFPSMKRAQELCAAGKEDVGCELWQWADWGLYFTVRKGGDVTPAVDDPAFWGPRLAGEPHYPWTTLPVTVPEGGSTVASRDAYLDSAPFSRNGLSLLGHDHDVYRVVLDDFAQVTFDALPAGMTVGRTDSYPYETLLPSDIQAMIGPTTMTLTVDDAPGTGGDRPYRLTARATYRTLPPDWGETDDSAFDGMTRRGRPVDLVTPDPAATGAPLELSGSTGGDWVWIGLQKPWAWQHTRSDVDYYDVRVRPWKTRVPGQPTCEFDRAGDLQVDADGMQLEVTVRQPGGGTTVVRGKESILIEDPSGKVLDGHLPVAVRHPSGKRGVYRFNATWRDNVYLTPEQCDRIRKIMGYIKERKYKPFKLSDLKNLTGGRPPEPPGGGWIDVFDQGDFKVVQLDTGDAIDLVLNSSEDKPVSARLFDAKGVLLGESKALGGTGGASGSGAAAAQSRLSVGGLSTGTYLLQVVPGFAASNTGTPMRLELRR